MADFRWIQVSLFVIAALQFTAAAELPSSFFTFRAGQEVTLPCENVIDDQQNCNRTTWIFSNPRQTAAVELITLGQIGEKSNSARLSVTQNCSLVIKKVTDGDVGRYECQQWKSGHRQTPDFHSVVHLSVVTMTEHRISDQVVWLCSVRSYDRWCPHSVKWLYAGKDVDEENILQTSQSGCSASVTFKTPHFSHTSNSDLLECEVTDGNKVQQQFPFRLQASGEKPGDDTTKPEPGPKTRPPPRTTRPEPKTSPRTTAATTTTTGSSTKKGTTTTTTANNDSADLTGHPWLIIAVPLVAAAFIVIVVVVVVRRRAKGKKTQTDEDVADPEGGVSYASVNFTRRPDGKAQVQGGDDDEDEEAVTYTTLKAPSSSSDAAAGASADANVLYATVNKPKK